MFTNIDYEKSYQPKRDNNHPNLLKLLKLRKIQKTRTKNVKGMKVFKSPNKFRSLKK